MASAYVVSVARLLREVPAVLEVNVQAPFDAARDREGLDPTASDVPDGAMVTLSLRLESYVGGLRARGTVRAPWRGSCRRCLTTVDGRVEAVVDERFVPERGDADELAYRYQGDEVDLAPLVHDAVFLELPLAPLCRPDCQGLCPQCGADRNVAPCACRAPSDPRWDTLDALRFDVETGGTGGA